jgi:hypothetical protein
MSYIRHDLLEHLDNVIIKSRPDKETKVGSLIGLSSFGSIMIIYDNNKKMRSDTLLCLFPRDYETTTNPIFPVDDNDKTICNTCYPNWQNSSQSEEVWKEISKKWLKDIKDRYSYMNKKDSSNFSVCAKSDKMKGSYYNEILIKSWVYNPDGPKLNTNFSNKMWENYGWSDTKDIQDNLPIHSYAILTRGSRFYGRDNSGEIIQISAKEFFHSKPEDIPVNDNTEWNSYNIYMIPIYHLLYKALETIDKKNNTNYVDKIVGFDRKCTKDMNPFYPIRSCDTL